ncbi:MAG: hypothetical protein NXI10_03180 [bacterium]|nr:hypothetical protein [bacterium]
MKKILLILALSTLGTSSYAQQYKTAIGIKGDWSTLNVDMAQFSVKHFFQEPNAFEINFGAGRQFIWLEGLYLYNHPLKNDFDWYAGGGVDLGYWGQHSAGRLDTQATNGFWGGATGVFGVEHTFDFIPINVALDAGPTLRMIPNFEVGLKIGFAVRYAFR